MTGRTSPTSPACRSCQVSVSDRGRNRIAATRRRWTSSHDRGTSRRRTALAARRRSLQHPCGVSVRVGDAPADRSPPHGAGCIGCAEHGATERRRLGGGGRPFLGGPDPCASSGGARRTYPSQPVHRTGSSSRERVSSRPSTCVPRSCPSTSSAASQGQDEATRDRRERRIESLRSPSAWTDAALRVLVPETAFHDGRNDVDVYAVDDTAPLALTRLGGTADTAHYRLAGDGLSLLRSDGARVAIQRGRWRGRSTPGSTTRDRAHRRLGGEFRRHALADRVLVFSGTGSSLRGRLICCVRELEETRGVRRPPALRVDRGAPLARHRRDRRHGVRRPGECSERARLGDRTAARLEPGARLSGRGERPRTDTRGHWRRECAGRLREPGSFGAEERPPARSRRRPAPEASRGRRRSRAAAPRARGSRAGRTKRATGAGARARVGRPRARSQSSHTIGEATRAVATAKVKLR